ncbi:helix-turn-helix domain-containing protein [Agromyces mariniharenae]|uniref:Helix-turn-helix domain-containing protein n=1 Tax=Agromyces mariniharenae TaxID=2604423 RepID=A0A5S4UTV3_9MICO|nr:helix-turn-helix domain-containing protein [Agromyces mariniharenae]
MVTEESYLTPDEVAAIYRVTGATIRRLIRTGEMRAVRVGSQWRIPRSALSETPHTERTTGRASA